MIEWLIAEPQLFIIYKTTNIQINATNDKILSQKISVYE